MIGAAVIAVCAKMFWDLRCSVWFWLALTFVAFCNTALIAFISWNSKEYPGIVLLPAALPDFALVYGIFKIVEKISGMAQTNS